MIWRKNLLRYLINKTSALGDIAQSLAVARYLKAKNSECQIDWIVEKPGSMLVERHPDVDRVIQISSRKWRKSLWKSSTRSELKAAIGQLRSQSYDAVFDLQGNFKSGLINCFAKAKSKVGFSTSCLREKCNALTTNLRFTCKRLPIPQRYLELVSAFFGEQPPVTADPVYLKLSDGEKRNVLSLFSDSESLKEDKIPHFLICPFSAWPSKHLGEEQLNLLIQYLANRYKATIWVASGSENERLVAERVCAKQKDRCRLLPSLNLPELQFFMRQSTAVFAMDSLPLHLAISAQIAAFGFFGPSHSRGYSPDQDPAYQNGKRVGGHLQGTCPYDQAFELRCPYMRSCAGPCLKSQTENELLPDVADFCHRLEV